MNIARLEILPEIANEIQQLKKLCYVYIFSNYTVIINVIITYLLKKRNKIGSPCIGIC